MSLRSVKRSAMLLLLAAACRGESVTSTETSFPVAFQVANYLIAPVSIAVDGSPYAGIQGERTTGLTVSSRAQWLTWSSAKPMDPRGRPIPDDIGEIKVAVSGINRVLEISNVIHDQTYFTAGIFNSTPVAVSIGVYDGASLSCVSELPASNGTVNAFTQTGYYKLLATTELRAYRDPFTCTGPYLSWSGAQLRSFKPKSGLVVLLLDAAP